MNESTDVYDGLARKIESPKESWETKQSFVRTCCTIHCSVGGISLGDLFKIQMILFTVNKA